MADFRWVAANGDYADLKDGNGVLLGYVGPSMRGRRSYVFNNWHSSRTSFRAVITDHPTEEAARAHVEAEVRRIHGGQDG